jgi:hypothetical protein
MRQHFDVRFGSKADICTPPAHVRFTPESGHVQCTSLCLLWAKSAHPGRGQTIQHIKLQRTPRLGRYRTCERRLLPAWARSEVTADARPPVQWVDVLRVLSGLPPVVNIG